MNAIKENNIINLNIISTNDNKITKENTWEIERNDSFHQPVCRDWYIDYSYSVFNDDTNVIITWIKAKTDVIFDVFDDIHNHEELKEIWTLLLSDSVWKQLDKSKTKIKINIL